MTPPMPLDAVNWFIMAFSLGIVWYIMRNISKRLGEALHMKKFYLLYDACVILLIVVVVLLFVHFVLGVHPAPLKGDTYPRALKLAFFAAALVEVAVTVRYWGWIVPEVLALRKK